MNFGSHKNNRVKTRSGKRRNMTLQSYIRKIVEEHLVPYLKTLQTLTFQQGNTRAHIARAVLD